jgi:hypothetical protein
MTNPDLETRLDAALTQLASGVSLNEVSRRAPDATDLLLVAQRLQVLAPVPTPRLADGRRKFLSHAARTTESGGWLRQAMYRPALALAFVTVFVLIIGGTLIATHGQTPLTPTMIPTFTATPTRTALVPVNTVPSRSMRAMDVRYLAAPMPVPAPAPVRASISAITQVVLLQCLTF